MPELPEVENVVRSLKQLEQDNPSVVIVNQANPTIVKYNTEKDFKDRLENKVIHSITRRGKFILLELRDPETWNIEILIVHLGMTGALLHLQSEQHVNSLEPKLKNHIFVNLTLSDNTVLVYTDYRRFGSVRIVTQQQLLSRGSLSHLKTLHEMGPEPFEPTAQQNFLTNIRHKRYATKPIKDVLLDQRVIAGVGNIYASECLASPKINPYTHVSNLSNSDLVNIFTELVRILTLSIQLGGSSIKDYVDSNNNAGTFQDHLTVYNQRTCKTCNAQITLGYIKDRATYHCPVCQPGEYA